MNSNEATAEHAKITAEPVGSTSSLGPRIPLTWWGLVIRAVVGTALLLGANHIRLPLEALIVGDAVSDETADMAVTTAFFLLNVTGPSPDCSLALPFFGAASTSIQSKFPNMVRLLD